jgi:tetratricopeptide (TPR) repeat protein
MGVFEFSRTIAGYKGKKQFAEALAYFKENKKDFSDTQIANNDYIIADMLYCLRGANYFDAGFQFLTAYGIEIDENTPERILAAYGWLLWSAYKRENSTSNGFHEAEDYHFDDDDDDYQQVHYEKSMLLTKIEQLIPLLLDQETEFSQTVISNLLTVVLKSEKQKTSPNWLLIDDFCNHFSPEELSTSCSTIKVERKGKLSDMELASDQENWYAYKTNALQKLKRWQECLDLSKEALDTIQKFHYSNDVWISRRIALSKKNLGSAEETIDELQAILKKKKEWFIQKELAEIYFEEGNIKLAEKYALQAVNNFGPIQFKIDLLFLLGKIYVAKNEKDLAFKHFSLSKLIRISQDPPWKVPLKLHVELRGFDNPEINVTDTKKLHSELKSFWKQFVPKDQPQPSQKLLEGTIKVILHDNEKGKDGFLTSGNRDYYFNVLKTNSLCSKIEKDTKVFFKVLPERQPGKPRAQIVRV